MDFAIALIAVAFGWLLSQLTEVSKNFRAGYIYKKDLLLELEDIEKQLERTVLILSRHLQFYSHRSIEPASFRAIPNTYFSEYFHSAFRHLNREQRISFQMIHSAVDDLNEKSKKIESFIEKSIEEYVGAITIARTNELVEIYGSMITAAYKTAQVARWHIHYHRENSAAPTLDILGEQHKNYLKFVQSLQQQIDEIVIKAKDFSLDDLKKGYYS
ncbi:hypothetical protein SSPSH_003208 [Salinisphaera shabanensis E1L3A]|uniref:Uncharacterized protein n=1 Tax=Salinisphaera shabanensis E1L3A TaxID=1033802 RepID=U2FP93_9GAMM|nr:hypothetical protein [Salinisphaera shabanensis]ERJ17989.1 hypothetical protein SSPSH_003208 [Salinisphaera shabanensis E1L3A]